MAKHLSPHDRTFRALMSRPQVIKEFLTDYLPSNIKKQVDLDTIKLQKESFIDDKLRMRITDLLYTAQFGKSQGYIYLLVEHQSTPDRLLPFRILKYQLSIMDHHLKTTKSKKLPIIYPLVLYNGIVSYNHSTWLFDLFSEEQRKLAEEILYRPCQLIDLHKIPDEDFKQHIWFGVLARMMKHIFSKDILPYFKGVIEDLKNIENHGDFDYIYTILSYIFEAGEVPNQEEFVNTLKTGLTMNEEKIMTLAQKYETKGRAEGKAEGKAEGEIAAVRKMAIKMLNEGLEAEKVVKFTEISEKELYELLAKARKRKG